MYVYVYVYISIYNHMCIYVYLLVAISESHQVSASSPIPPGPCWPMFFQGAKVKRASRKSLKLDISCRGRFMFFT